MTASFDSTKTGFQPVAEGHEFIDLRNNAILLIKRWEGNCKLSYIRAPLRIGELPEDTSVRLKIE